MNNSNKKMRDDFSAEKRRLLKNFRTYIDTHYLKALRTVFENQDHSSNNLYWHIIRYITKTQKESDEDFFNEMLEWLNENNTFAEYLPNGKKDENSLESIIQMPEFRSLFEKIDEP